MSHRFLRKSSRVVFLLLTVLSVSGCQQRTAGKLLGRWEGRPDTAAARAERESQKYGDETAAEIQPKVDSDKVTDWESYDLSVSLDFVDHERVEMAHSDGSEPLTGKWRILSTSPIGCTIEVETESEGASSESESASPAVVRRRFQLDLDEREGTCVGFTLMEVGADRQLGTLYFCRPDKSE